MLQRTLPAGFIARCLPTKTDKLPSGSLWLHEIKHDGFRIIARKTGSQVRLYSRPGNDLTHRFPLIVETLARLRSASFSGGHHACCGVASNCCCDVSAPRGAVFKLSAAPLPPPKPAIAWTRPTTMVWAGSVCPAITASTVALFLMVYDSRSPLVFLSKRFWDESSAIEPTPAYIQSVSIMPRNAVPTILSSLML